MPKKIIIFLSAVFLGAIMSFPLLTPAFADDKQNTEGYDACEYVLEGGSVPPSFCDRERNQSDAIDVVKNVLNTVYFWLGILAVVFIIIGGYNYTMSQGDPGKVAKAKSTILYAIIGLVIALMAFAITSFVLSALNGTTGGDPGTPGTPGTPGESGEEQPATPTEIESITVEDPEITIKEGETYQINVNFQPENVDANTALEYKSSDPNIASVSLTGKITAKNPGGVSITITTRNGKTATVYVTVIGIVRAESISVSPTEIELKVGETANITATIKPPETEDKKLTWSSSAKSIASVDKNGKVTAKATGIAKITAKTSNGLTAVATVTVKAAPPPPPSPTNPNNPNDPPGTDPVDSADGLNNYGGIDYWLHVPTNATNNMPIIVFLHGSGETRKPNAVAGLPQYTSMIARKDFISIAPVSNESYWDGQMNTIKGMINEVANKYRANTNRIYVFGFSMGGSGTFSIVNAFTTYFRAAAPASGCPPYNSAGNLSKVPMRFIVGTAADEMRNYYYCMSNVKDEIINLGGTVEWAEMPGATHTDVQWNTDYNALFDWLLAH